MGFRSEAHALIKEMEAEITLLLRLRGKEYNWQKKHPWYVKRNRLINAEVTAIRADITKLKRMLARNRRFEESLDKLAP